MSTKNIQLDALQSLLFEKYASSGRQPEVPLVFVLASPRTGSTLLYQALIRRFSLSYFSNLANDEYHTRPVIAAMLESGVRDHFAVDFASRYGKTDGVLQPSEASYVHRNWYGGSHPAQLNSRDILEGMQEHFVMTMASCVGITGQPLVTKNAWNCFRVQSLAAIFPNAFFVWLRRDIADSARSHLAARVALDIPPEAWNSATPWNFEELLTRPVWEHLIENQYEFNTAIGNDLRSYAADRYVEVWYENFLDAPGEVLEGIYQNLTDRFGPIVKRASDLSVDIRPSETELDSQNVRSIRQFVEEHSRLSAMTFQRSRE